MSTIIEPTVLLTHSLIVLGFVFIPGPEAGLNTNRRAAAGILEVTFPVRFYRRLTP